MAARRSGNRMVGRPRGNQGVIMSHEFIEKLQIYWKQHGNRPPSEVVEWLARSAPQASEADKEFVRKHVERHLLKVEKALLEIYSQEGEPEREWLAILRQPGLLDLSDTLALTVIARWYAVDPLDQHTRVNLLAGIPMSRRSRPSEARLNSPRIIIGRLITVLVILALMALCWLIARQLI